MPEIKERTGNMYYKGTWRYCADYQPGDVVSQNGDLYMALDQNAGLDPADPLNSDYWRLVGNYGVVVNQHNALDGLQGGNDDERYHLTADEHGAAEYATDPSADNPFMTLQDVPYLDRRLTEFELVSKPAGTGMLYSAVFCGDKFIAVGDECVLVSPDGVKWTEVIDTPDGNWRGVAYGGGAVSVVGLGGKGLFSDNGGAEWVETVMPAHDWNDVCFGNGIFIAVGDGRTAFSLDGLTRWTALDAPKGYGESITFDSRNGRFVSVGPAGARWTRDGEIWTEVETPSATWRGIACGAGRLAAVAGKCMTSADGTSDWELEEEGLPSGGWDSLTFGGGFFVGVGSSANVIVSETPNERAALYWDQWTVPNYVWRDSAYGMDRFVVVGGGIMVSHVVDVAAALQNANMPNGTNPFLTKADIGEFNDNIDEKINEKVDGLRDELNEKIDELGGRVDEWEKKLDDTIHEADRRLDLTDERMDKFDERMDKFDERMDAAEQAIAAGGGGGGGGGAGMTPAEKAEISKDISDIKDDIGGIRDDIDDIKRDIAAGGPVDEDKLLEVLMNVLNGAVYVHVVSAAEERNKAFSIDADIGGALVAFGGVVQTPDADYVLTAADGTTTVNWSGKGLDTVGVKAGDVFIIAAIGGEGSGGGGGGAGMTPAEKAALEKSLSDANKAIAALEARIAVLEGKHEDDEDDDGNLDVKVDGGEIKVP